MPRNASLILNRQSFIAVKKRFKFIQIELTRYISASSAVGDLIFQGVSSRRPEMTEFVHV